MSTRVRIHLIARDVSAERAETYCGRQVDIALAVRGLTHLTCKTCRRQYEQRVAAIPRAAEALGVRPPLAEKRGRRR